MTSDGPRVRAFLETFGKIVTGEDAGTPIQLKPFQKDIIDDIFTLDDAGLWKHRFALVQVSRKAGKSLLGSGICLYGLFALKGQNHQIYATAASREQAGIVFKATKQMLEAEPELAAKCKLYRDAIENLSNGNVFKTLSSDGKLAHGLNPSLTVIDELHVHPNGELTEAIISGSGARRQSLAIALTTPGSGEGSYLKDLVDKGRKVRQGLISDPTFYFHWNEPPADLDHRDETQWPIYNPGVREGWIDPAYLRSQLTQLPEGEFRRLHLGQWTASQEAYLPHGAWQALEEAGALEPGTPLVLGIDGSWDNDSTAIVGTTFDDRLYLLGHWQKPESASDDWHTPFNEVRDRIFELCDTYNVRSIAMDPYWLTETYATLEAAGLPVEVFRTNQVARMTPATQTFLTAVLEKQIKHDHDPTMALHFANAYVKSDRNGMRVMKESKGSKNKIDIAVAAIVAYYTALFVPAPLAKPSYEYI